MIKIYKLGIIIFVIFPLYFFFQQKAEKNWTFFKSINIQLGMCQNKATLDSYYGFRINYKPSFIFTTNIVSFKNLSINLGLGYRTKTIYGFGNDDGHLRFKPKANGIKNSSNYWNDIQNININYLTFDGSVKYLFLKNKKISPFLLVGSRVNFLLNFKYQNENIDSKGYFESSLSRDVLPALKSNYLNMIYGIGINYRIYKNIRIVFQYELNDDLQNHPAAYYNPFGYEPFPLNSGLRFQTQSLYLGASYKF